MFSEYSKLVHLYHSTQPSPACLLCVEMYLQCSYIGQRNFGFQILYHKGSPQSKILTVLKNTGIKIGTYFIYFTIKQSVVEDFLATVFFNEQCIWLTRELQFHNHQTADTDNNYTYKIFYVKRNDHALSIQEEKGRVKETEIDSTKHR
jgi:hypothetical protein